MIGFGLPAIPGARGAVSGFTAGLPAGYAAPATAAPSAPRQVINVAPTSEYPSDDTLAQALIAQANAGGPPRSGFETLGRLAEIWRGTRDEKRYQEGQKQKYSDIAAALAGSDPSELPSKLLASRDPEMMKLGLELKLKPAPALDTKEIYDPASKTSRVMGWNGASGRYDVDMGEAPPAAGATGLGGEEHGLVPVYGQDTNGNVVILQTKKGGGADQVSLPPGVSVAKNPIKMDLGTSIAFLDPVTRQVIQTVPKDVAGAAAGSAAGTVVGNVKANLPLATEAGDRVLSQIDSLLDDPDLSTITGPIQSYLPNVSPGANRAQSKLNEILGGTFLQAYNDLRGAGQISNAEGESAKAAYNRLQSTNMGDADYKTALGEFRDEVVRLMDIAKRRASGNLAPLGTDTSNAPAPQAITTAAPVSIEGDDDYDALPSGTMFKAPDGSLRRKP